MFILYDIIFFLFAALYFPFLILRRKWHSGFKMRLSGLRPSCVRKLQGREHIWIHAVSVGEVLAVSGLIQKIREAFPQYRIVFSTVTQTGNQLACEKLGDDCVVIYAPLDFSWIVHKFIAVIRPKIYISAETEIWPNLYMALHKEGVPIVQVNGRISDKAFKGYKRVRFLTKRVLACVNMSCMQSSLDAKRIEELGAASEKVRVVGNLKFDNVPQVNEIRREDLGFQEKDDLLIAGSTHPGEEDVLVDTYKKLEEEFCNLRLVIVPRHVERSGEVIRLVEKKGYKALRFSQIKGMQREEKAIVVVDTIGHLRALYTLAKVVFIGKTLTVGGGQNMIESACLGKPTIVGPLTQNFKDAVNIFLKAEALIQISSKEGLLTEIHSLLTDPQRADKIGRAAKETVENHQGATSKTIEAISKLLV